MTEHLARGYGYEETRSKIITRFRMMNPPEIDLIWEGHGTFDVMKFVGRVGGNSSLHYTAGIEHISEIV